MAKSRFIESLEEQYTKKDGKSILRYKAPDGKWRYINGGKDDKGEKDPSLAPSGGGNVTFTDGSGNEHELISKAGLGKAQVIETTWQELKDLRDNGELVAGSLYRITDYNCTTTQENTQSAGHQFDIVLLALSENKLAEEGWAMMNESNVYDVTFADDVTLKCWIYCYNQTDNEWSILAYDGQSGGRSGLAVGDSLSDYDIVIDETNKTAMTNEISTDLLTEYEYPYNYFQNSNLSAWKVWYCLDNDKSRFAWADDRYSFAYGSRVYNRAIEKDVEESNTKYFAYDGVSQENFNNIITVFFTSEVPKEGDIMYQIFGTMTPTGSIEVPIDVKINGTGVIYRLIDEWNNDVPYDFKNILYLRKLTAGVIDAQGTDTYIPTFCLYDMGNTEYRDASIFAIYYTNDENMIGACYDNTIKMVNTSDIEECYASKLPNNIILELVETGDTYWQTHSNIIFAKSCSFCKMINSTVLHASEKTYTYVPSGIIFGNKQVVWEDIS